MKRLLRAAMHLYPAWWRRRYAREFEALLDDLNAGPRELFNVLNGAIAMQLKSFGAVPVVCAVAGSLVGTAMTMRAPDQFASTAIIRVDAADTAFVAELRRSLDEALVQSQGDRAATSVVMAQSRTNPAAIQVTYHPDREPFA